MMTLRVPALALYWHYLHINNLGSPTLRPHASTIYLLSGSSPDLSVQLAPAFATWAAYVVFLTGLPLVVIPNSVTSKQAALCLAF